MEKLSAKKKLAVVKSYLSGSSYDEISIKTGVSKGAVTGIVVELKGGCFPEVADLADQVELLRELSLDLKHAGLAPGQCAVGLAVLNRIKECGLEIADIERWPEILKLAGSEDKAKEFIQKVYHIQDAEKETGLTIDEIDGKIQELESKAAELQPTLNKVDEKTQEIAELEKRRDDLAPVVDGLEKKYELLNPIVNDLQKRQSDLVKQIKQEQAITASTQEALAIWSKENKKLGKAGFSHETLVEFNDRARAIAARHHIPVSALRERLLHELEVLDKGLGLEALVETTQTELKKQQEALISAKNERKALEVTIGTLSEQKAGLEAGIKATRDEISVETAKIVPAAKEMLSKFTWELQQGDDEILGAVQHIKDQALETGREIGRYQGIVEANEWLVDLLALTRGEDSLEAMRVRAILLLVIRGTQPWMKRNLAKVGVVSTIPHTLALLVEEPEQWHT